ncbi:MAG: polysaccharide deacetylase family protein [Vampirovibrionales bacterium]
MRQGFLKQSWVFWLKVLCTSVVLLLLGDVASDAQAKIHRNHEQASLQPQKDVILSRLVIPLPQAWGETVRGVRTHFVPEGKELALTLDACGSARDGYDKKLIDYLVKHRIPATLFINQRWIRKNARTFTHLSKNALFSIQNHGTHHKPCAVSRRSIYGIESTANASECYDEIQANAETIERLTHKRPMFYRSGTAYYDTTGVTIAQALRHEVLGFSILGDRGASYTKKEVYQALLQSQSGDIIIAHMNHPESDTAEGLLKAIPALQKRGFRFVLLEGKPLK